MSEMNTMTVEQEMSEQNSVDPDPEVRCLGKVGSCEGYKLVVDGRTLVREGRGASRQLVDEETGEVVISDKHHTFGVLEIGELTLLTGELGGTKEVYTTDGSKIGSAPELEFLFVETVEAGGRTFYKLVDEQHKKCLVDPETGEFLTDTHNHLVIDGTTVKGTHHLELQDIPDEVVELEPDPVWKLERDLANDEPVRPPRITGDVVEVCEEYVEHNDFEWVLDLENELEAAMT